MSFIWTCSKTPSSGFLCTGSRGWTTRKKVDLNFLFPLFRHSLSPSFFLSFFLFLPFSFPFFLFLNFSLSLFLSPPSPLSLRFGFCAAFHGPEPTVWMKWGCRPVRLNAQLGLVHLLGWVRSPSQTLAQVHCGLCELATFSAEIQKYCNMVGDPFKEVLLLSDALVLVY